MESQKWPQQAAGVLSVVKAGQTSQPWPTFPPPSAAGAQSRLGLSHKYTLDTWTAAWRRSNFSFSSLSLTLWRCSVALKWPFTFGTTCSHWSISAETSPPPWKKIKLTDWIHYKHALWGTLAGWGGIGSNMLWLCATQTGQSYSNRSIKARLVTFSRLSSVSEKPSPEMQSQHSAQSTQSHFQGLMSICCTSQTLH